MSEQTMYPGMTFRDAQAALRWMKETLGAEELLVVPDGEAIRHAEIRLGGGVLMFGSERVEGDVFWRPSGAGQVYIAVDDVDSLHDRVVAAGGDIIMGLTDTDYGSRDFSVRDPEGNHWYFGTYRP
jgi:uncharacterized glyoxalase superfamily protein PhnB